MNFLRWLFRKPNKKPKLRTPSQGTICEDRTQEVVSETPSQDTVCEDRTQEVVSETAELTFYVDGLQRAFKELSRVGEFVNLYIPRIDYPDEVYIYHKNGPGGCLGLVPSEYSYAIISHKKKGLESYAKIVELTDKTCKINCRLVSKNEKEIVRETEKAIAKAKDLEKTNKEEAVCLYKKAMGILKEIDQQCGKGFTTLRKKQRYPINRLSLVLERQKKYKECLEEIEAYEKLLDEVGLLKQDTKTLAKRKERMKKRIR
jgi:hypothetical protein